MTTTTQPEPTAARPADLPPPLSDEEHADLTRSVVDGATRLGVMRERARILTALRTLAVAGVELRVIRAITELVLAEDL